MKEISRIQTPNPVKLLILFFLPTSLALIVWAISSPVGSSPDDDFHLGSIWCAEGAQPGKCDPIPTELNDQVGIAKTPVIFDSCFAFKPETSASCVALDANVTESNKFNNGLYPSGFYRVMHKFITEDILHSVLSMRTFNVFIFIAVFIAAFITSPPRRRRALTYAVSFSLIPLGYFLIPSTNPSSWSITSSAFGWVFLVNLFEQFKSNQRKNLALIRLNFVFYLFCLLLAISSRKDSLIFLILISAIAVYPILSVQPMKKYFKFLSFIGLTIAIIVAFKFTGFSINDFLNPKQTLHPELTRIDLFLYNFQNLLNIPIGTIGFGAKLGWLDTPIPQFVGIINLIIFTLLALAALPLGSRKNNQVFIFTIFIFLFIPLLLLHWYGAIVGEQVQPRYIYPLIFFIVAFALDNSKFPNIIFEPKVSSRAFFATVIAATFFVSIATNIRRYVTGLDTGNLLSLNKEIEWWQWTQIGPLQLSLLGTAFAFIAAFNASNPWVKKP